MVGKRPAQKKYAERDINQKTAQQRDICGLDANLADKSMQNSYIDNCTGQCRYCLLYTSLMSWCNGVQIEGFFLQDPQDTSIWFYGVFLTSLDIAQAEQDL